MEQQIIEKVVAARNDRTAEDILIKEYMPFIKSETSKFIKRVVLDGDDELSIAMIAFHEAIHSYNDDKGTFISYAAIIIRSRLIDYYRREKRHVGYVSIHENLIEGDSSLEEIIPDNTRNQYDDVIYREATKKEILELTAKLKEYDVSLEDVAKNCPKQKRSKAACIKAMQYARNNEEVLQEFLRTRKLPITRIVKELGIPSKTLERHRKYIVALFIICTNGYEIIRGHLQQIMKGGQADEVYSNGMSR